MKYIIKNTMKKKSELSFKETMLDARRFIKYLSAKQLSDSTIKSYLRFYLNTFIKYKYKKDYTPQYIVEYLSEHKSPNARAMLKAYLEYRQIPFNFPKVTGRKPKKIIKILTADERKKLRIALYERDVFYGLMYDLTYYCALREGELLNIRFKDFDWKGLVKGSPCRLIVTGKGNKQRYVFVPYKVMEILKKVVYHSYAELDYDSKLFEYSADYWRQKLYEVSEDAIGRRINPHLLRHTRTSDWFDGGLDIHTLSKALGHENISTTQRYVHADEKKQLEKIKQFALKG